MKIDGNNSEMIPTKRAMHQHNIKIAREYSHVLLDHFNDIWRYIQSIMVQPFTVELERIYLMEFIVNITYFIFRYFPFLLPSLLRLPSPSPSPFPLLLPFFFSLPFLFFVSSSNPPFLPICFNWTLFSCFFSSCNVVLYGFEAFLSFL